MKYTDPTGHYSEEEIMESFGVSTWDEVLALFSGKHRLFNGRWGWLALLRRAENGNYVSGIAWDAPGCNFDEIYAGSHVINRDNQGRITIGEFDQDMFAHQNMKYILDRNDDREVFSTDWDTMYLQPEYTDSPFTKDDRDTIVMDIVSLLVEGAGVLSLLPTGGGFVVAEVGQFGLDLIGTHGAFVSYKNLTVDMSENMGFTSDDILGVGGGIPGTGAVVDIMDIISHATGKKIEWRP